LLRLEYDQNIPIFLFLEKIIWYFQNNSIIRKSCKSTQKVRLTWSAQVFFGRADFYAINDKSQSEVIGIF